MKYLKNIYFLLIALLMLSCYDDKGNYNYKDLPEFNIDSLEVYDYVRMQDEILQLAPVVKYAGNESDLSFLWTIRLENPKYDEDIRGYHPVDTLSEEKSLNYTVNLPVNQYVIDFTIYNKVLDTKQFMSFNLDVQSAYSKGWMLLVEREDGSDIDFIKTSKFFSDIDAASETVYKNIYSIANGKKLNKGNTLVQDYLSNGNGNIYVLDENAGGRLSTVDLSETKSFTELFTFPEDVNKPTAIGFSRNRSRYVVNNGQVHCDFRNNGFEPSLVPDNNGYDAAPFILYTTTGGPGAVIYDNLNRRFLQIPLWTKKTGVYEAATVDALFDMNNIGKDIVHMENGFNGYAYNIFKDVDAENYYLYVFDVNTIDQAPIELYSMENCTDIANATCFAFGTRGNVCYYTVDNKIYQYNYFGANDSDLEYEFAAGEKVVSMKIYKDMATEKDPELDSKVLVVATYNESSKAGKVYMFDINETNGSVSSDGIKSYDVDGKVIDMGIKN